MLEQPDRPAPAGRPTPHSPTPHSPSPAPAPARIPASPSPSPSPADSAPGAPPWQGPEVYNKAAAAAGAGMRVESADLLAAARALAEHDRQTAAAAAGLRVEPRAAGHPNAATALTALADRFHTALTALDADRGAAVGNLEASARIYEAVEVRVRDDLLNTLEHSPAGRTRTTPSGPTFPAAGPGR
jgi:hypothetical protein